MKLKFIDKNKEPNLNNGIEFFAVGLVVSSHLNEDGSGNISGKDYAVEFIDPFGNYCHEWRGKDEIIVASIDEVDYEHLRICYEDNSKS